MALSHIVDESDLLATLGQYLDLIVPGQADTVSLTTISGAHLALFGLSLPLDSVSRGLAYVIVGRPEAADFTSGMRVRHRGSGTLLHAIPADAQKT